MTAEAMLCWQFLGISRDHPACDEAANYLLSAPPGVGPTNFYYWYYGTFVMYQFQGEGWQRWNTAVATQLVGLQNKGGPFGRILGPRFRLGRLWRPDLQYGLGRDVPGGLLPLLAGIREQALRGYPESSHGYLRYQSPTRQRGIGFPGCLRHIPRWRVGL